MKTSTKNLPVVAKPEVITPEVVAPLDNIDEPDYNTPGERVRYHIGMAQHHGRQALAHLILAGWELSKQKKVIGYGGWVEWCDKNLQISRHSADRYIQFYQKTVGEARDAAAIPLAKKPTIKELSAATVGMEQKSATRAMIDLDIIKRPKGWGGEREGAGRHKKGAKNAETQEAEAKEEMIALDEVADTHANAWSICSECLRKLQDAQRDHRVIDRLDLIELAEVSSILKSLSEATEAAIKRIEKV